MTDATAGPLGVYEPLIALVVLAGMLVVLFGVNHYRDILTK
jgi:hypothetical protein